MAYLKSTTIGGKLNVIGTLATNEATIGSTTVNGIATSITNDATKLATAKAVYDYITSNAGVMSSTASGKTVTTKVTTGGWFAKNATSSASVNDASGFSLSITDKSTTNITVGTVSNGYYPLSASLTGTFSASTAGWFSSGSATDSSVVVGRVAAASVTPSVDSLTAPSVTVSGTANGFTASSSATSYYVTVSGSGTNGSVKAKETRTAGYVKEGYAISTASTITPTITGSGGKVYIPAGKAQNTTTTQTGATASLSGTTITLTKSLTPTVTAGYIASGTAANVSLSGTVPTETKSCTPSTSAQTISPSSGKLLSSVTVSAVSSIEVTSGKTLTVTHTGGTVKYSNNWSIVKDSSGNLTFTYSA